MYKIETGIEIPPRSRHIFKVRRKYPFDALETGQSFLVPLKETEGDAKKLQVRVAVACANAKKRLGHKFVTRSVDKGVRVWRVA